MIAWRTSICDYIVSNLAVRKLVWFCQIKLSEEHCFASSEMFKLFYHGTFVLQLVPSLFSQVGLLVGCTLLLCPCSAISTATHQGQTLLRVREYGPLLLDGLVTLGVEVKSFQPHLSFSAFLQLTIHTEEANHSSVTLWVRAVWCCREL